MELKLLYTVNSPYARKVRVVAAEKHIELNEEAVDLSAPDNAAKQFNPLGKVPVLIMPNEEAIYDSPVIVEYLDKKSPVANLIPVDQELRVQVRSFEALADGICDAAVTVMLEQRRDAQKQDSGVIERQKGKVVSGLMALEKAMENVTWLVNDKYSLADIAVGCMLGYVSLRFGSEVDLARQFPNLERLHESMLEKTIFAQTKPQAK